MGIEASTIGMLGLGMQAAGGLSSAYGATLSAETAKANLKYQATVAEANKKVAEANLKIGDMNANIAEMGAQNALMSGQRELNISRLKTAHLKSSQRAALAANGVDVGAGTAAELQYSAQMMGDIDAEAIQSNAIRAAFGYRMQGINAKLQAITTQGQIASLSNDALIKSATASGIDPGAAGMSSLLGSAGQVASSWYMMNKGA